MERKDFLKNACKYGVCGCIEMSFVTGTEVSANEKSTQSDNKPDWRIDFMQSRYKDLIYIHNDTR